MSDKCSLTAQGIGMTLDGLQGMSTDQGEVRELLSILTRKINTTTVTLDCQSIGMALYGLQRMSSEHKEVRDLLQSLSNLMKTKDVTLSGSYIAMVSKECIVNI